MSPSPSLLVSFEHLAIALFIGALVGAERGRHAEDGEDPLLGLRTFTLIAAAGAASAHLATRLDSPAVLVGAMIGVSALVLSAYLQSARTQASPGVTTEISALLVFVLGAAAALGPPEVPVALAVAVALVLALKNPLHQGIRRLDQGDVMAGLKLLFATFIVLPLLPREPVDPWGALRPYSLWWLVILIASISLVGYVGVRWLGQNRGTAVTGLFGGLVSSTAVSLSFARRSRETPALSGALAAGVLIAWLTMAVRVLVEVAVVERSLLASLIWPMLGFAAPCAIAAALAWRRSSGQEGQDEVALSNPFSLISAVKVGGLFAAVLVGVKLARLYLPGTGVYVVSALAGLTDVDAITLSLAQEVSAGALDASSAVRGVLIAVASNTLVKLGMIAALGSRSMTLTAELAVAGMVAGGGLALFVTT